MQWKPPKNTEKYYWTKHVGMKMRYYGLSEQRVRRVIRRPLRTEVGIATETVAVMQPQSTKRGADGQKTWSAEIWVMYQLKDKKPKNADQFMTGDGQQTEAALLAEILGGGKQLRIISAWRYPGKTKEGEALPDEIMDEINEALY